MEVLEYSDWPACLCDVLKVGLLLLLLPSIAPRRRAAPRPAAVAANSERLYMRVVRW